MVDSVRDQILLLQNPDFDKIQWLKYWLIASLKQFDDACSLLLYSSIVYPILFLDNPVLYRNHRFLIVVFNLQVQTESNQSAYHLPK